MNKVSSLRAVLGREFRAAILNLYLQVFSLFALAGGLAATNVGETADAAPLFVAQLALYIVSLFALLVGVSAARAESEEWPILFSQPAPRWVPATGKVTALVVIFAIVLLLLFGPVFFEAEFPGGVALLYAHTVGLAGVFGSLGVWIGYRANDRAQGLLLGASAWLALLIAFDLVALVAAHWPFLQKHPDTWVGALMLNPLDAFRINALFAAEKIPAEAAGKTPLAGWWLNHPGLWLAIISAVWTLGLLWLANRRVARMEV